MSFHSTAMGHDEGHAGLGESDGKLCMRVIRAPMEEASKWPKAGLKAPYAFRFSRFCEGS
jgi:hypothetical protein